MRAAVILSLCAATILSGCANPEKQIVGTWSGSAMLTVPKTGRERLDRFNTGTPEQSTCKLEMKEDKTYTETFDGPLVIKGKWSLANNTVTLTPSTFDGKPVEEVRQTMRASAKEDLENLIPGISEHEDATYDPSAKTLSVKAVGGQIPLKKE